MLVLGSAVLAGNTVTVQPPEGGFGGIKAVRLSNYTGDVLILTNISSESPGQEYLLPFQQNVYHVENVRTPPRVVGQALGTAFSTAALFVEWSTEPLPDFPGTYPTTLTQASIATSQARSASVNSLTLAALATTYTIPSNAARQSLTIINSDAAATVQWNTVDANWANQPSIAPGSGRTISYVGPIYLRTSSAGSKVEWFED